MKRFGSLLLAAVLGSVVTLLSSQWIGGKGGPVYSSTPVPVSQVVYSDHPASSAALPDFTSIAEKATKSVVHIRSTSDRTISSSHEKEELDPFRYFFGPEHAGSARTQSKFGSGVIINTDGYIVTNNHVVQNADVVEVTLSDNRTFKAEVIGTDPDTDLALIRINQKSLPFLSFVNSDQSKIGEWVLAVGNPFNLNSTVTAGIISAKGRNINIINSQNSNDPQGGLTAIESFIQTDAAINPGNSGGALVNMNGELLGINTAIASPTGSYSGYGFAIPSNIVSKIVEDLMTYGTVQRGWLGIQVTSVNSDLVKSEGLSVNEGAFVSGFGNMADHSAAKEAGLQKGDVIVRLDETAIKTSAGLIEYIGRKRPGDKIVVAVNRDGKALTFPVTLKNKDGKFETVKREEKSATVSLGIELVDADPKLLKSLDLTSGVMVKSIENGKIARYTDMRDGFIITRIDEKPVKSVQAVKEIIKSKKPGDLITFSGVYEDFPREYIYAVRI